MALERYHVGPCWPQSWLTLVEVRVLDDGITDAEKNALSVLHDFAERVGVEAAIQVMDYQWLADGVNAMELQAIIGIASTAKQDQELAERLLGYQWLADGVTWDEVSLIDDLKQLVEDDPEAARQISSGMLVPYLLGLVSESAEQAADYPWLADGVNAMELQAIIGIASTAKQDQELAERLLGYTWLADGITEAEARGLGALSRWALLAPELVDRLLKYAWLDDGITDAEKNALSVLHDFAERVGVEAAIQVMDYQWLADGVNAMELQAIIGIARTAKQDQELAERLLGYQWLADGVSGRESYGINSLASITRSNLELAQQIVGMGILDDPLRDRDLDAITSLSRPVETDDVALLTSQPWFTDGLSDEETAFLVVAKRDQHSDTMYRDFLRTHFTRSATISLPLAGDVDVWVFWHLPFPDSDDTIELIEDAARGLEDLMGVPFPTTDIILLQGHPDSISFSGYNAGSHMAMDRIVGEGSHRGIVYHETAHYYYMGLHSWFNEGFADLVVTYTMTRVGLRSFAERENYLEEYDLPGCIESGFRNIQELLDKGGHACLGEFFLVSVFNLLGEEATSAALKELYLMPDKSEEDLYRIFLKHTPHGLEDEFRDLYRRLHGGPAADEEE